MDYKYINQLLERYWQCETSLEEEDILRAFFSQKDVPAEFLKYRQLFAYEQSAKKESVLGNDFDSKILSIIDNDNDRSNAVKVRHITMTARLMPLFKAAAVVAIIITLGNAAQFSQKDESEDINYAGYKDTYNDPSVAYDKVQNALELVSEGMSQAQQPDSTIQSGNINDTDSINAE